MNQQEHSNLGKLEILLLNSAKWWLKYSSKWQNEPFILFCFFFRMMND